MNDEPWRYRLLIDATTAPPDSPRLELPEGIPVADAALALAALLAAEPDVEQVTVVIGGAALGAASRSRLARISPHTGRDLGDSDGATLPGGSAAYRLLRFRCAQCGLSTYQVHVEGPDHPLCPSGHGPMVAVQ